MLDSETLSAIEMIRDSARAIVPPGDLTRIRRLRQQGPGFDRAVWGEICGLGWPALRVPEDRGGVGLGALAYCALAEELGRGLVPEPLIPAVLASALLEGEALAGHLSGAALVLPAWADARGAAGPQGPLDIADGRLTATRLHVPVAAGADAFVVIGTDRAMLVAADAPGVTLTEARMQDGTTTATLRFEGARGRILAADPQPALAEAALATAAYLLGLMEQALDITAAYLKTRVQFGKTIGQFQILQHMAVDLKLEIEVTRASVEAAAAQWDAEGPTAAALSAVSRAKARASAAAMKVTRDCVQLHGGIGFTDEHDIGLFLRKAMVEAPRFGGAAQHRAAYARLNPLTPEA